MSILRRIAKFLADENKMQKLTIIAFVPVCAIAVAFLSPLISTAHALNICVTAFTALALTFISLISWLAIVRGCDVSPQESVLPIVFGLPLAGLFNALVFLPLICAYGWLKIDGNIFSCPWWLTVGQITAMSFAAIVVYVAIAPPITDCVTALFRRRAR